MREPLEMFTASRLQDMVQIRKKNTYSVTKLLFWNFATSSFGALGVESPHDGAILTTNATQKVVRLCGPQHIHSYTKLVRLFDPQHNIQKINAIQSSIKRWFLWTVFFENMDFRNCWRLWRSWIAFSCCWCVLGYILMFWVFLWDSVSFFIYEHI